MACCSYSVRRWEGPGKWARWEAAAGHRFPSPQLCSCCCCCCCCCYFACLGQLVRLLSLRFYSYIFPSLPTSLLFSFILFSPHQLRLSPASSTLLLVSTNSLSLSSSAFSYLLFPSLSSLRTRSLYTLEYWLADLSILPEQLHFIDIATLKVGSLRSN